MVLTVIKATFSSLLPIAYCLFPISFTYHHRYTESQQNNPDRGLSLEQIATTLNLSQTEVNDYLQN
jgi:hypothetical protein